MAEEAVSPLKKLSASLKARPTEALIGGLGLVLIVPITLAIGVELVRMPADPVAAFQAAQRAALQERATERQVPDTGPASTDPQLLALRARVEAEPQNPELHRQLGGYYVTKGDLPRAIQAFRNAVATSDRDVASLTALAEIMTIQEGQRVTPEAEALFTEALEKEPLAPSALFYLGLAEANRANFDGAVARWRVLAENSPPDAPWLASLRNQVLALAASTDRDPVEALAAAGLQPPPPTAEGMPDERAMVAGLSARLEAEGGSLEEWLMLIRSHQVLGDAAAAQEAADKARAAFPDGEAAIAAQLSGGPTGQ